MATRDARVSEFETVREPDPTADAELLCEDHRGTYLLPFPCRRIDHQWQNTETGEEVLTRVIGWRPW